MQEDQKRHNPNNRIIEQEMPPCLSTPEQLSNNLTPLKPSPNIMENKEHSKVRSNSVMHFGMNKIITMGSSAAGLAQALSKTPNN